MQVDSQVLKGQTYYNTDAKVKHTGAMTNQGTWTKRMGVNEKIIIPAGYHNGSVYVDQPLKEYSIGVYSLAVNGIYTIPEGYYDGSEKITQFFPVQGGSTITPGTANKTVVAANRYVNGNVTVAGDGNLIASNIKKGVTLFGVKGTFEG